MVAYNFQPQFRAPISAGTKRQTVRAERKRHARPGEQLQLYTGMRTRQVALIGRAMCIAIEPIRMRLRATTREPCFVETPSKSLFFASSSLDAFARADGFAGGWDELVQFWAAHHPGADVFTGVRIQWGALTEVADG